MKTLSCIVTVVYLLIWMAIPALAGEPRWQDVPQRLKTEDGAERRGEFLCATGMARAENIRPDKAHEIARKKSLLRAFQMVHMEASCPELLAGLDMEEGRQFLRLFAPLAPDVHLEGVTIIRQWEEDSTHYTTIAVPLKAVEDLACEFPDLSSAISRYIESETVSSEGLNFCLRHSPRYSVLNRVAKERAARWFEKRGLTTMALCFIPSHKGEKINPQIEPFVLQNRLFQAARLTAQARELASKSRWKDALSLITRALDLAPDYSHAYLILADYFLLEEKNRSFALCATEMALRDGTCLKAALARMVSSMRALQSPEAEVYDFLLSHLGAEGVDPDTVAFPKTWKETLDAVTDSSVPYMVIISLGRVVDGQPQRPGPIYLDAQRLFSQAKTDADLAKVVQLLMQACEEQPVSPEIYNLIGACFRHFDRSSLALPFLWPALTLRPEYDYAFTNLGLCCQELGLMKAAGFYFDQQAVKESSSSWVQECYIRFHETDK